MKRNAADRAFQQPVGLHPRHGFAPLRLNVFGEQGGLYVSLTTMDIFRDMVESTDDLVVRLDHRGRVFYISPSTEKIYGVPPGGVHGEKGAFIRTPRGPGRHHGSHV